MSYLLLIPALLIIAGWAYVNIYRWDHIPVDPADQRTEEEVLAHVDADLISLELLIASPLLGAWLLSRYEKHSENSKRSEHTESDRLAERQRMRDSRR